MHPPHSVDIEAREEGAVRRVQGEIGEMLRMLAGAVQGVLPLHSQILLFSKQYVVM